MIVHSVVLKVWFIKDIVHFTFYTNLRNLAGIILTIERIWHRGRNDLKSLCLSLLNLRMFIFLALLSLRRVPPKNKIIGWTIASHASTLDILRGFALRS